MSLSSGLDFWRSHRRTLAGLSLALSLLGPAPAREGFDLTYPLIRVFYLFAMDLPSGQYLSQLPFLVALWSLFWGIYGVLVFLGLTPLVILAAGVAGATPPASGRT